MKSEAVAPMIELLTPIWQRVLQLPSVGVDDDFFDLGGDSSLALQLFDEIARACNRELPPVTIYQARTLAALAALLEQAAPKFPALVLLKPGFQNPPIFLAHGLGGSVIDFFQPVRRIESDHPIYGMQSKGIDGLDEPSKSVEEMAEYYLQAIREVQTSGPYTLIGYSLGGLVTLEMAQRLTLAGEKIALLVMIDAYPNMRFLSLGQQIRLAARQVARVLSFGHFGVGDLYQPPIEISLTSAVKRVREAAFLALRSYQPRFYPGRIKFIRAAVPSKFPADAAAVWRPLAREIEVQTVPGDHLGMIATHYDSLASVLSRYLREAFAETPATNQQ